jgi:hypothetical protein
MFLGTIVNALGPSRIRRYRKSPEPARFELPIIGTVPSHITEGVALSCFNEIAVAERLRS